MKSKKIKNFSIKSDIIRITSKRFIFKCLLIFSLITTHNLLSQSIYFNQAGEKMMTALRFSGQGDEYQASIFFNQAIDLYSKDLSINPSNGLSYIARGLCYYSTNRHRTAINDFNKALLLSPEKASDIYQYRGNARLALGNKNGACSDYQKAIKLGNLGAKLIYHKFCY